MFLCGEHLTCIGYQTRLKVNQIELLQPIRDFIELSNTAILLYYSKSGKRLKLNDHIKLNPLQMKRPINKDLFFF